MKKKFILIMFLMLSCILRGNYVFTTDGKDNFDKLSKSVWRNRLEKAEIKKIKNNWHLILGGEELKIYSLNNGIFYVNNPYLNEKDYYGYNVETDELWRLEQCDEGWCNSDVAFERFEK